MIKSLVLSRSKYRHIAKTPIKLEQSYRVLPWHMDFNLHMNNASYLRVLEHSRWNYLLKSGWFATLFDKRINIVVAAVELTYIKELLLFKQFKITTEVQAWTEKYLYFEQKMMCGDVVYAHALFKIACVQNKRLLKVPDLYSTLGLDWPQENNAQFIERWNDLAQEKKQLT